MLEHLTQLELKCTVLEQVAQIRNGVPPSSAPASHPAMLMLLLPAKLSGEFLSILNQESSRKSSQREDRNNFFLGLPSLLFPLSNLAFWLYLNDAAAAAASPLPSNSVHL